MRRTIITVGVAAVLAAVIAYYLPDVKRYVELSRM
jgi:hypothetical protein